MSRPPALTPEQQNAVRGRLAAGEGVRALASEFGVGTSTIQRISVDSARIRNVAETVAHAQAALATLPVAQQYTALSLAEKLRNISNNLAGAAEHGAATAHRLNALANSEVCKVADANPMASIDTLRNVGVLTKLANESATIGLALLSANKDAAPDRQTPPEPPWALMIGSRVGSEDAA